MEKGRLKGVAHNRIGKLGNVRVGIKNEQGIPRSLDHFVADGEYKKDFDLHYGYNPRKLLIFFPSDDPETVCNLRYECRDQGTGKLLGHGDGAEFEIWNEKNQRYEPTVLSEEVRQAGKWSTILTLRFMLPEIVRGLGFWQFSTRAKESSIQTIVGPFDAVKKILEMTPHLFPRIPFELIVESVVSQKPGSKNRFPVVSLIPNLSKGRLEEAQKLFADASDIMGLLTDDKFPAARLQLEGEHE